ncbi:S8 family serine peptidase [Nannocystis pusilla]|uniref:S8 family serine peptidase n=1 Tax=Nannocystis pusilla TaxID=889268 RepID=UPI003BF2B2AF
MLPLLLLAGACVEPGDGDSEVEVEAVAGEPVIGLDLDLSAEPGPIHVGAGDHGDGVVNRGPEQLQGTLREMTPAEFVELAAMKPRDEIVGDTATLRGPSFRERLSEASRSEEPGTPVRVFLELPDQDFPWHEFANKARSDDERRDLVRAREAQLAGDLDDLEQRLAGLGARATTRFWLVPSISAEVPVEALETIAQWPELAGGMRDDDQTGGYAAAYTAGVEGRNGMRDIDFIWWGYDGYTGHRYTSDYVRAGLWDSPGFPHTHPAFKWNNGTSRVIQKWNCDWGTCVGYTPAQTTSHASKVGGVMAASIEYGQDPSITTVADRIARSGIARRSTIYYYTAVDDPWSAATAVAVLQRGTTDALDVMNMSGWWGNCGYCDRFCDKTGWNVALRNATNAGTLHVFIGGNDNVDNVSCRVPYPGTRRDGLTVGALDSTDTAVAYDNTAIAGFSARGGMDLGIAGTVWSGVASLIDITAPGCYTNLISYDGGAPNYNASDCGTSYAAPSVAGSVAMALTSFYQLGWSGMDARMTQTYMIMMGSGWAAEAGTIRNQWLDKRSGAGRLHNHFMSGSNLTNPWAWACRKDTISHGQERAYPVWAPNYPLSASITTWKAAVTWQEDDYNNAADLDLKVYNTCPAGGGSPVLVVSDVSRDLRARVRMTAVGGMCLEYRISGYHIPAGQTRTFTACDYYQSGSAADH